MDIDELRKICLSFPGATEQIQWGDALLFKVGGKMFAVASLEPARVWLSLKASPENFAELIERPNIIPAPYLARAKWIGLESREALPRTELAELLRAGYELIVAKLPRKVRETLAGGKTGAALSAKSTRRRQTGKTSARKKERR